MPMFTTKQVPVQATQWFPPGDSRYNSKEHPFGCDPGAAVMGTIVKQRWDNMGGYAYSIRTRGGWYELSAGDWIITEINGDKLICKPDRFEATYDPAPGSDADTTARSGESSEGSKPSPVSKTPQNTVSGPANPVVDAERRAKAAQDAYDDIRNCARAARAAQLSKLTTSSDKEIIRRLEEGHADFGTDIQLAIDYIVALRREHTELLKTLNELRSVPK